MRKPLKTLIGFLTLYFLIYSLYAMVTIFFPLYFYNLGVSKTSIGVLFSIGYISSMMSQAIFGRIADKLKNKNMLLTILFSFLVLDFLILESFF